MDLRLVAIGGGGGSGQLLLGARPHFAERAALIAVTDSGRSTGAARAIAGIPAPGDLRNVLALLAAEPEGELARLFQHRLRTDATPLLAGMALGNLLLGGLAQLHGDFAAGVAAARDLLGCPEQILPIASADTQLCAELADGGVVRSELAVRGLAKARIRRLFLDPPAAAHPPALGAIAAADLIAIGPGSLFTSLLASLCFDGVAAALRQTKATVVFVCNTTAQPGQTDGLSVADHVAAVAGLLGPGALDVALINDAAALPPATAARYAAAGLTPLAAGEADRAAIRALGVEPLVRDLAEADAGPRELWNKADTIRHDPQVLGMALWKIALDRAP